MTSHNDGMEKLVHLFTISNLAISYILANEETEKFLEWMIKEAEFKRGENESDHTISPEDLKHDLLLAANRTHRLSHVAEDNIRPNVELHIWRI